MPYEENWILFLSMPSKVPVLELRMVTLIPALGGSEERQKDPWEFEVTLVYTERSRLARAAYRDTISKKRKNKNLC